MLCARQFCNDVSTLVLTHMPLYRSTLNLGHRWQHLQDLLRTRRGLLNHANQAPELLMGGIAHALIHPALTRRHDHALLGAQAVQRDQHLGPVAATDAVGQHVHAVAGVAQVQRRLRDADVRLDADQRHLRPRGQRGRDGRDVHGELGLVVRRRREQLRQRRDRGAELGWGLHRGVDGDGEGRGEGEELLSGGDAGREVSVGVWTARVKR